MKPSFPNLATSSNQIEYRRRELVLSNGLVDGNTEIADLICGQAIYQKWAKGHRLIRQGNEDDTVYFILSGSMDIRISGKHIDCKRAPDTVGEMAAKRIGAERTADVFVSTDEVEVFALSGVMFRQLMVNYPNFNQNLDLAIDTMNRAKIAQLGEPTLPQGLSWHVISTIVAVLSAIIFGGLAWFAEFNVLRIMTITVATGIGALVAMLLLNPSLIYRNMFRLSGLGVVVLIAYGSISWALTVNGEKQPIPFLLNFNVGGETKASILVISVIALITLSLISAHYDDKLSRRK